VLLGDVVMKERKRELGEYDGFARGEGERVTKGESSRRRGGCRQEERRKGARSPLWGRK